MYISDVIWYKCRERIEIQKKRVYTLPVAGGIGSAARTAVLSENRLIQ